MKPLRVGVNMSRAHYEKELHNTMETRKKKVKGEVITLTYVGWRSCQFCLYCHKKCTKKELGLKYWEKKTVKFLKQFLNNTFKLVFRCLRNRINYLLSCFDISSVYFPAENSVLSVTVGDEKLPNMTSESQIQVSDSFTFMAIKSDFVALSWLNVMFPFRLCTQRCTRSTWSRVCWCG